MSGRSASACSQRLFAVRRLGDDLELGPRLGEARLELRAQQRLVFGDQRRRHDPVSARRNLDASRGRRAASTASSEKRPARAKERGEPVAHVGEPDTLARTGRGFGDARARVGHGHRQAVALRVAPRCARCRPRPAARARA